MLFHKSMPVSKDMTLDFHMPPVLKYDQNTIGVKFISDDLYNLGLINDVINSNF